MIAARLASEETESPLKTIPTVHEALSGPKAAEWKAAMVQELETMRNQETWELVNLYRPNVKYIRRKLHPELAECWIYTMQDTCSL
jgi:hypothetical protein